jgi:hypothetical protein
MILNAYKGEKIITADEAARHHHPGDRYEDILTGKPLRLHIGKHMRNHFEYEPRWADEQRV